MANEVKAALIYVYSGVSIEYVEETNKWRFELRGRERNAESIKQAKEWIDKPEPVKKSSKSFATFKAHMVSRYSFGSLRKERSVVTVTSAAQDFYRGTNTPSAAWIKNEKGERSKESVENIFEISEENAVRWRVYDSLVQEIEKLSKQAANLYTTIKRIDLTPYLDGDENK